MKRQYYSSGVWGQDTWSHDAGAGSRGVDIDCCDQGLGRCQPDCTRSKYSLPYLRVYRSTHCRDCLLTGVQNDDFVVKIHCYFLADLKRKLVYLRNHADAMFRLDADAWIEAEKKEIQGLIDRGCFKIVDCPPNRKSLPTTMVCKYKYTKENDVTVPVFPW